MNDTQFSPTEVEILEHMVVNGILAAYREYNKDQVKGVLHKLGLEWNGRSY
jgi:hypothetical protein